MLLELLEDWDIGDGRKILADEIRARDGDGLKLYDDGGNGLFIDDGGKVGHGTVTPASAIHVKGTGHLDIRVEGTTHAYQSIVTTEATGASQFRLATNNYYRWAVGVDGNQSNKLIFAWWYNVTANQRLIITSAGAVGIGAVSPTAKLDVNSDIIRLRTAKTPASAGAAGNQGDICWDASYIYICTATNTWKRAAIATW